MVLGAVEYLVAGLALLRTKGCLTLVGSGMEVQLVVILGGADDIARSHLIILGSSLGKTDGDLGDLGGGGQLLYASRGGVRDAQDGAAWNLGSVWQLIARDAGAKRACPMRVSSRRR